MLLLLHLVTCAVLAVSTVRVGTCAGVGALCVLTSCMFVTVRSQSTLIHILTHRQINVYKHRYLSNFNHPNKIFIYHTLLI